MTTAEDDNTNTRKNDSSDKMVVVVLFMLMRRCCFVVAPRLFVPFSAPLLPPIQLSLPEFKPDGTNFPSKLKFESRPARRARCEIVLDHGGAKQPATKIIPYRLAGSGKAKERRAAPPPT